MPLVNPEQVQKVETILWVDQNTSTPIEEQDGTIERPYSTVQPVIDHVVASAFDDCHVFVAFGDYSAETLTIPPNKHFIFEGRIRLGNCLLGSINWTVTGNMTSRLGFRSIEVGVVNVIDDVVPAINTSLTYLNSTTGGITATGSSYVTMSIGGATIASFGAGIAPVIAGVVNGPINVANGDLLVHNVQFNVLCTLVKATRLLINGCSFSQNIESSGTLVQINRSNWLTSQTITFTGLPGSVHMDEPATANFIEQGCTVVNGTHTISTQRSTGWLTGGAVTRSSGLSVDVASGTGYVFQADDIVYYVTWTNTNLILPSNQLLDICVDIDGTVQYEAHPSDQRDCILLAIVYTNVTDVVVLTKEVVETTQIVPQMSHYLQQVVGPIHLSGLIPSIYNSPSLQVSIDAGTFYIGLQKHTIPPVSPITFTYWYRNISGGWIHVDSQTAIDPNYYDNGSGTLTSLSSGQWKKDVVYISNNDSGVEFHTVYAQEYFSSQTEAEFGNRPTPPDSLTYATIRCAGTVVEGGSSSLASIVVELPQLGQLSTGSTTVTDHGLLTGLSDDDHTQYQLRTEKNQANGYAGLSVSTKLNGTQQTYGSIANTAVEGNDARVPTQNENDALQGTNGSPSNTNRYVTDSDPRLSITYYAESLGEDSTTSTIPTYVNKLTLNVTPTAGTYILEWNYNFTNTTVEADTWTRVWDGTTVYSESRINCSISYANSGWEARAGFIKLILTNVNMNFYIDFCRQTGTAWIKNAKLLLRRIA